MKRHYVTMLSIAGSDSSGGAGIQADIKTCSAIGVFGTTAITAITAQNTCGVTSVLGMPPELVTAQIDAVFADEQVDAVKIGMLFNAEIVHAVAQALLRHKPRHIVLDPVMISTSGRQLIDDNAIGALMSELMPISTVVTPNRHEAERLAGREIKTQGDMLGAAECIIAAGANAVLMKGGHFDSEMMTDLLVEKEDSQPLSLSAPFVNTKNNHGTGCTLSPAIASHLALGKPLREAVQAAKTYLSQALQHGAEMQFGKGNGPVNHFFNPETPYSRKI